MSALFNRAWRSVLFDRNPIRLLRQSAKWRTSPNVFTPTEIRMVADNPDIRERTLVLAGGPHSIPAKRVVRAEWGDIDFAIGTMNTARSIAYGVVEQRKYQLPIERVGKERVELSQCIHCFRGAPASSAEEAAKTSANYEV